MPEELTGVLFHAVTEAADRHGMTALSRLLLISGSCIPDVPLSRHLCVALLHLTAHCCLSSPHLLWTPVAESGQYFRQLISGFA